MIFNKLFWITLFFICVQQPLNVHAQVVGPQDSTYKICIIQSKVPSLREYTSAWPAAAQRVNQLIEPKIELIEQNLSGGPEQTEKIFEELAAKDVVAIIAPTYQVELWISSAPGKPLQRFSVVDIPSTQSALEQLSGDLSAHLMEESVLHDQLRKLKFRGELQEVLLLPVKNDPFSPRGTQVLASLLDRENNPFQNRELSDSAETCSLQLRQIKFDMPEMTLMVSTSSAKAEEIINEARNAIGLAGLIIALTGDYQPTIFGLGEENSQNEIAKHMWPIRMEPSYITQLSSDLQLPPSAVPFLARCGPQWWG